MKRTLNLSKILLFVTLIGLCATSLTNAQALKVREYSGNKFIHVGLNDPNSTSPTQNWILTFGKGGM